MYQLVMPVDLLSALKTRSREHVEICSCGKQNVKVIFCL